VVCCTFFVRHSWDTSVVVYLGFIIINIELLESLLMVYLVLTEFSLFGVIYVLTPPFEILALLVLVAIIVFG
jgi:hypothetical protein